MRANKLIPELYCSDFKRSLDFYTQAAQFVAQDPDGYLLRFFQDLGATPSPGGPRRQP